MLAKVNPPSADSNPEEASVLNAPPPKSVVRALTHSCKTNGLGLLTAVGYDNVVNLQALIESRPIREGMINARG